jgi:hypothetical protein
MMIATDLTGYNLASTSVIFESQLHALSHEGVISRDSLPLLQNVEALLVMARANAALLEQQAYENALAIQNKAEVDGQAWLDIKEIELQARFLLQQTEWLGQLQPFWMQALERALRQICGGLLKSDVLVGAIDAGTKEFKDLAELHMQVHPDDWDQANSVLLRSGFLASLVRVDSDSSIAPGSCRLRNPSLEVTLNLDRAIDLALGKL